MHLASADTSEFHSLCVFYKNLPKFTNFFIKVKERTGDLGEGGEHRLKKLPPNNFGHPHSKAPKSREIRNSCPCIKCVHPGWEYNPVETFNSLEVYWLSNFARQWSFRRPWDFMLAISFPNDRQLIRRVHFESIFFRLHRMLTWKQVPWLLEVWKRHWCHVWVTIFQRHGFLPS